jgi:2-methylisocitrate lyase-like PEP mutase family enzyme
MLCVLGDWDEVIDRLEAYREAGARTVVVRFATRDQLGHLEAFAEALGRRKLFSAS